MALTEDGKFQRPSWDEYFAKIVEDVARRSTCFKRQIGALVVSKDHEIVSTGFNGNVRGAKHCDDIGCIKDEMGLKSGEGQEWCTAVHAEQNALLQAGKSSRGSTLYVNAFPCKICARLIVNAGIRKVVVSGEYTDKDGLKTLAECGVEVVHVKLGK
ncbi:MAG: dCMP deaminase family protein [Candidatus Altiarchaeota archaeon]